MLPTLRTDSAHRALTAAIAVAPLGLLGGLVVYAGLTTMFQDDVEGPPLPTRRRYSSRWHSPSWC